MTTEDWDVERCGLTQGKGQPDARHTCLAGGAVHRAGVFSELQTQFREGGLQCLQCCPCWSVLEVHLHTGYLQWFLGSLLPTMQYRWATLGSMGAL